MRFRLIHGIHSPEGANNMSALAPHMQAAVPSAKVELFEYGFMGFWAARFKNDGVAKKFAGLHKAQRTSEPEIWITHSNGAAIAYLAVERFGAAPDMIINFNPALDRWRTARVRRVETIHSENDRAVYFAQWLPGHIWGDQGKVGYKGELKNTLSHNATKFGSKMAYKSHTGAFEPSRIGQWADFVGVRVDEFVSGGIW